jgi:curli biogenesis system outer membrane secretion channel CsgG
VAVLPFKGDLRFSEELSDLLVTELVDRGFTVVERAELLKVIHEHSLQYTGGFDPGTLAANGKLAGVDYIVLGTVSTRQVVTPVEWLIGAGEPQTQIDSVHIRWVNVGSGQVVASARIRNSWGFRTEALAERIARSMEGAIHSMAEQQHAEAPTQTLN